MGLNKGERTRETLFRIVLNSRAVRGKGSTCWGLGFFGVGVVPDLKVTRGKGRYLLHHEKPEPQNAKIQNEKQNGRHPVPKWK